MGIQVTSLQTILIKDCGAMKALLGERDFASAPYLKRWISVGGENALQKYKGTSKEIKNTYLIADRAQNLLGLNQVNIDEQLPPADQLSQLNVLQQVENLLTFKIVRGSAIIPNK